MKFISYAGATYSTGTDIADAVLAYSVALARRRLTELVRLPFVSDSGETLQLELPVGWMREIASISQPAPDQAPELEDAAIVEVLTERTEALEPARLSVAPEPGSASLRQSILWSDFDPAELEY